MLSFTPKERLARGEDTREGYAVDEKSVPAYTG